jgi:lipoate---protein ligase
MLCIDNPYTDACFNLAAEEYLFKNFSDDVFMLWQNGPSVIVGKHQNIESEVNLAFSRENSIKVVRRFSGGGAVYHDLGNINLTFIESNSHPDFNKYTKQILGFLSSLGIHAQANERRALYIDGMKISGCAQYIRKNKVLFHATLLYSTNLNHLASSLNSLQTNQKNGELLKHRQYVKSVKDPVTNLSEHIPSPLLINDFKKLIIKYFLDNNLENSIYSFSEEDITAITLLKQEKYVTTD